MSRSYSELILIPDFLGRYKYLKLGGRVGAETFGYDRYLNQKFYRSKEWRTFRDEVIIRDNACDLALDGFEIHSGIYIHHINPITKEDIIRRSPKLFDMENVITTTLTTHQAIHYGDETLLQIVLPDRQANDTTPWKKGGGCY